MIDYIAVRENNSKLSKRSIINLYISLVYRFTRHILYVGPAAKCLTSFAHGLLAKNRAYIVEYVRSIASKINVVTDITITHGI